LVINGNIESNVGYRNFELGYKDSNELTRNYFFIDESGCLKMDFDTTVIPHRVLNRYKRLVLFYAPDKNYQTYGFLAAQFQCPLVKNEEYLVSFSIRNKRSNVKWRKIAYILSSEQLFVDRGTNGLKLPDESSTIYQIYGEVLDTFNIGSNFTKYTFRYKAKGGEMYLYIGNFHHEQPSKKLINMALSAYGKCSAEYEMDDIEVSPLSDLGNCMVHADSIAAEMNQDSIITLGDILFLPDSYELSSTSTYLINDIATHLNVYSLTKALILGHTDNTGSLAYNLSLSQKRAEAVRDRLVQLGISPDRILAIGYGSDRPITDNSTEIGKSQNRRVEVVFNRNK